ncbi:peptide chain release factor N(5)-glutamine methyltransferase [Ehrlichia ruminantium]|uniref:HemK/PrmC family methyltransferase n=1 Tax=Ehrlichia ruminantium TaxID=779 RepID=UPI00004C7949|nr:HemK/PrmC family methyltransferase [Ehrlichia ruminantium]KYW95709.1 protein-(glutamine-N5) methyltransferase, release factor-specific [Ehrlichia ruminantium]QLK50903.1 peptide chain release factor N(5)-glutamine methyltransferase [Ehrlichia ruminantium]QLK51825.1 peptide chain release factor N(5)-glutamine methyltransferase [Ehrlichia ruminantium]QLK53665.1 peptide chain release factor N(5)-glutamine methyltransferase [Ehrlichia ruminantium]QLK59159.1 peptide chain release factor N(5)-glut
MNTIASLFNNAVDFLNNHNIDNPKRDVEVIIRHLMNVDGLIVVKDPYISLNKTDTEIFWDMVKKRALNVPISHIIGKREFWSMDFIVNSHVLDPRPDSESIISAVFTMYPCKNRRLVIGDFGTGTGCLLTVLLSYYKLAVGIAVEKNVKAYRVAYQNFKNHKVYNRIKMRLSSWNTCYEMCDLIVSNPPYIRRNKIMTLQPEVKLYEPYVALDGGPVGLENYFSIFVVIKRCLKKNGVAVLEIGEDQLQIHHIVCKYGLKFHSYCYDLSGKKRCIIIKQV